MTGIRLAAIAVFAALAALPCRTASAQDVSQTVMTVCTGCHDTQRICRKLGEKGRTAWSFTVSRMIFHGAKLPEKDKPAVVDWLVSQEAGSKPLCE